MAGDGKAGNRLARLWRAASGAARAVFTPVLLGVVWVLIFVPGRLALVLLRRDPLKRRFPGGASSYWVKSRPPAAKDRWKRQFS